MSDLIHVPAAALGLLLAFVALLALCSSVLFWYEALNRPEERIPAPRPGMAACLRHYGLSLISYTLCLALLPFGPALRRPPRPGRSSLPPLILVHGLNNNASVWAYLARALVRAGYPLSTFSYSSFRLSPEEILGDLDAHIRRVESLSRGQRPVIVGHSLGGLLARRWLEKDAGRQDRVLGIITVATPHQGSAVAVFSPGDLARSIRPGGALAAAREAAPPGPACVSLISPEDEAVLPHSLLLPPPGWSFRLTAPLPHFLLLFSPSVAALLLEELEKMRLRGPLSPQAF